MSAFYSGGGELRNLRRWGVVTGNQGVTKPNGVQRARRSIFRPFEAALSCCGEADLPAVFDRDVPFPGESNDFFNRPRIDEFVGADSSAVSVNEMANQIIVGGIGPSLSSRFGGEFDSRHIMEPNFKNRRRNPESRFNDEPVIADAHSFQVLDRGNENDCDRTSDDEDRSE
jgi:hypothetical protein